jgi:hypothetical protein
MGVSGAILLLGSGEFEPSTVPLDPPGIGAADGTLRDVDERVLERGDDVWDAANTVTGDVATRAGG